MIIQNHPLFELDGIKTMLESFEQAATSVVITEPSPEEYFLYVNDTFKQMSGYEEEELLYRSPRMLQGPMTDRSVIDTLKKSLEDSGRFMGQTYNYRKDGSIYFVRWSIAPLRDGDGKLIAYISFQNPLSIPPGADENIFFTDVLRSIELALFVTKLDGEIVFVNEAFMNMTGYSRGELIGKTPNILKSGHHPGSYYKEFWENISKCNTVRQIFVNRKKSGALYYEDKTISIVHNEFGEPIYYVSIGQDVSKLIGESESYKDKAYHDELTGLYNRLKLDEVLTRKISMLRRYSNPFSIIFIDIDHFKSINDHFGHTTGDEVLKNFSRILLTMLRRDDLLVRWGGEEFLLLVDTALDEAYLLAEKLRKNIAEAVICEKERITASFGVTGWCQGDTVATLFARVDQAMYHSKHNGRNQVSKAKCDHIEVTA